VSVKEQLTNAATNLKVGAVTGAGTVSAGAGTWFDVIPDDIGKLASLVGICLSSFLIYVHALKVRQGTLDITKTKIEIEMMKAQQAAIERAALENDQE